ncbi:MAG TPA: IS3 family transposase [Acidimicrobiales bacterium]|nr:IS3 family transposase [Acidimicrobiales bacterium]
MATNGARRKPLKYPDELRERAVKMVIEVRRETGERHGAVTRVARELGIGTESLRNWVNQADVDAGRRGGTTTEDARRISDLELEVRELRRANDILKAASGFLCDRARRSPQEVVAFIDAHRGRRSGGLRWGVEPICDTLQVAPSTYYSAKTRPPSARAIRDAALIPLLVALFVKNYSVYGRRKLTKAARKAGLGVGRDQVARLMRTAGIRGASRSKKRFTTKADPAATRAPDLLNRDFTATGPNQKWVADFTYCSTWSGVVYVAFVIDVYSRRIVGWKAARTMTKDLVIDALNMAAWVRRGVDLAGLVCHTDAGSQYTSIAYTDRLDEIGAAPSIGTIGDSFDNAMAESVISLFKTELHRNPAVLAGVGGHWRGLDDLEVATCGWVSWFNEERFHGELGDLTPAEVEKAYIGRPAEAA